jgi:hypothetical protein
LGHEGHIAARRSVVVEPKGVANLMRIDRNRNPRVIVVTDRDVDLTPLDVLRVCARAPIGTAVLGVAVRRRKRIITFEVVPRIVRVCGGVTVLRSNGALPVVASGCCSIPQACVAQLVDDAEINAVSIAGIP